VNCIFFNQSRRSMTAGASTCLALAIASNLVAQTTPNNGSSVLKNHYDSAQSFQAAGKFEDAAHQYRLFIADALAELALQAINLDDYTKAAPLFDEALELAPRSPGLKVRYAQAAFAAHDFARTRTLSEGILRDYPDNPQADAKAHLLLGRTLSKMNQEAAARQQFEAAVALDSNFENGYALAVACLDLGDGEGAAKIFSEMIAGLGDTPALHIEIGRAYLNSDFQHLALPEFKKAVDMAPTLPGAHYALAVAYLNNGTDTDDSAAKSELEAELKLSPNDASTYAQLGSLAYKQHRYQDAEQQLNRAAALNPNDPTPPYYLGQLYSDTGKSNEAITAFQRSIALTKDPSANRYQVRKTHYLLGRLLLQVGQADAAKQEMQISAELLKKSLSKDRDRQAGDFTEIAPASSAETKEVSPDRLAVRSKLEVFEKQLSPAIADSYNNLGAIAASDGRSSESLPLFERAYEWNPMLPNLDSNWGLAAYRSGNYAEAVRPLTRSLQEHGADVQLRSQLAISLFKTKDYAGTLKVLEPLKQQTEATPVLAYARAVASGTVAMQENRLSEAIRDLEAAEKLSPDDVEAHEQLELAYRKAQRERDADREQATYESLAKGR
jgi:tetratricopeptide (TPR) repeat protein